MTVREFLEKVNAELGAPEMQERRIVQIVSLCRDFTHGSEVSGIGFYLDQIEPGIRQDTSVYVVDGRCEER